MANKTNKDLGIYKIRQDIVPYMTAIAENGGVLDLSDTPMHIRLALTRLSKRSGVIEYKPMLYRKKEFKVIEFDFLKPKIQVIE